MSTLGKIFAFIVLVSAVAFASVALVISQQSGHWKKDHEALKKSTDATIKDLNEKLTTAESDTAKAVTARLAAEGAKDSAQGLTATQATEIQRLGEAAGKLKTDKETLDDSFGALSQEFKVINDSNAVLGVENKRLLDEKNTALKAQKKAEDDLAKEEDDNRRLRGQLKLRTAERDGAREEIAAYVGTFGNEGVRLARIAMKKPTVPMVNGRVNNADNNSGIVEVSVGKDDGLSAGQTLEVVRPEAGTFVGRIRVEKVYDERAICRIDRTMTRSMIRRGDHVTTRIK